MERHVRQRRKGLSYILSSTLSLRNCREIAELLCSFVFAINHRSTAFNLKQTVRLNMIVKINGVLENIGDTRVLYKWIYPRVGEFLLYSMLLVTRDVQFDTKN